MKVIYKYLILSFTCFSCLLNNDQENKSRFNETIINHFPKEDINLLKSEASYPNDNIKTNMGAWYFTNYKANASLDIQIANLTKGMMPINLFDQCVLILPHRNYINLNKGNPSSFNCKNESKLTIIPSFIQELIKVDSANVFDNFTFYIIEESKGKYLHENLLLTEVNMPLGWEHGLTRGLAIDSLNNEIYFWVEMW